MRPRSESGVVLVAAGLWLVGLAAVVAIAVEVARLTDTATEVQVAADSGAMGGALALVQGRPDQAVARGTAAAGNNRADGRSVDPSGVLIEVGHYSSDPSATPHFTTTCTGGGCNAVKATVTVDNVQYLVASILGGQETSVQKNAVAAGECQGSAEPFPLAICKQVFQQVGQDNVCGSLGGQFVLNPQGVNSACWTDLGQGLTGASSLTRLFPAECGGDLHPEVSLQQTVSLQNGAAAGPLYKALQCCVACPGTHDYTVAVVDCPSGGTMNCAGYASPPIIGFATIHIANPSDVDPPGTASPGGGGNNCSTYSWACSTPIINGPLEQISVTQACQSDRPGTAGGTNCVDFGNTVVVLGQLP